MGFLGKKLAVAIPDTILEKRDSLREKTVKLGLIARACSIYGVDVIQIFADRRGRGEAALVKKVLEYLETPQYLRRRLYPIDETLRFAGLLPPLRIPSHKPRVQIYALLVGEIREGVANGDGSVDVGLDKAPRLTNSAGKNRRVTVRIASKNPLEAEVVTRREASSYWGYSVEMEKLEGVFADSRFTVKVATSRLGAPFGRESQKLKAALHDSTGVKLIFGSPSRGLFDQVGPDLARKADFVLNLFAEQHVESVRTEEAIFAGLSLVTILFT